MNFSLLVHPTVYNELSDAIDYYDFKQEGLGERFVNDWRGACELLEKHPFSFQKADLEFRQISFQKFPYMLIYEIEGTTVHIYRLIYSGREPSKRYRQK